MKVTNVKLIYVRHREDGDKKLKAYANIILDSQLAINAIKIIDTGIKRHLVFPEKTIKPINQDSRPGKLSLVNPITSDLREHITEIVMKVFDDDPNNPRNIKCAKEEETEISVDVTE